MIKFTDRANIGITKLTDDGYLVTQARALRTGVQVYRAHELGLEGDQLVKVMRPVESVFHKDSLASLAHAPVTMDHPSERVTSENWKQYAVGEVSTEVLRDGEYLALNIFLKDAKAIKDVDGGKRELSASYQADLHKSDNPDYDYVMQPPIYDHVAIVDRARAGSQARIGDNAPTWGAAPVTVTKKEPEMDLIKVMVGDKAVQVAAADADFIAKMVKDHQAAMDAKDETIGELKAECAEATAKILTDEAIDELVTAKAEATARREAVKAKFGDEAVKDATDAEIKGIYSVMDKAPAKVDPVRKALADAKPNEDDPWAGVIDKMYGKKERK
jgi:uncharacterized protein